MLVAETAVEVDQSPVGYPVHDVRYRDNGHCHTGCHLCVDQLIGYSVRALGETPFDQLGPRRLDSQLPQYECSALPWALLGRDQWLAVYV